MIINIAANRKNECKSLQLRPEEIALNNKLNSDLKISSGIYIKMNIIIKIKI